jgi:hypothetical protein
MTEPPSQISGHCLCGKVTYHAEAAPFLQAVCHCADCQRQSGAPFSVVIGVPRAALTVEGDTLASFSTVGDVHGTPTERQFCSACGSPIVSLVEAMPDVAWIKAGTLDDGSWITPVMEVFTRSEQPWAPKFESTQRLETAPSG